MPVDRTPDPEEDRQPPTATAITRGLLWYGVAHGAKQVTSFGSLILLGALLAPDSFGTLAAALAVIGIPSLLLGAGTRGAIITSPGSLSAGQIYRAVTFVLVAGTGMALIVGIAAGPLLDAFAEGGDVWILRVMALALPLQALTVVPTALLERRLEFKRIATMVSASTVIAAVTGVLAALLGAGGWALVVRYLLLQALLAVSAWVAARGCLPRKASDDGRVTGLANFRLEKGTPFLFLALADFVALGADNLVVGRFTDASRLGLYALAFQLAFAPLTQLSWQIGAVLFPAAAATGELELVGRRTLKAARLLALMLLPAVPPVFVLAEPLLPALFGDEWAGMVGPFRILLIVGAAHGVLNVIGESLSATGNVGFRARVHLVWAISMVCTLIPLVSAAGITGAAVAHLLLFFPFAAAYGVVGTRLIGTDVRGLVVALRGVLLPVCAQAVVTAASVTVLSANGVGHLPSAVAAALVGVVLAGTLLASAPSKPLREGLVLVRGALSGSPG